MSIISIQFDLLNLLGYLFDSFLAIITSVSFRLAYNISKLIILTMICNKGIPYTIVTANFLAVDSRMLLTLFQLYLYLTLSEQILLQVTSKCQLIHQIRDVPRTCRDSKLRKLLCSHQLNMLFCWPRSSQILIATNEHVTH